MKKNFFLSVLTVILLLITTKVFADVFDPNEEIFPSLNESLISCSRNSTAIYIIIYTILATIAETLILSVFGDETIKKAKKLFFIFGINALFSAGMLLLVWHFNTMYTNYITYQKKEADTIICNHDTVNVTNSEISEEEYLQNAMYERNRSPDINYETDADINHVLLVAFFYILFLSLACKLCFYHFKIYKCSPHPKTTKLVIISGFILMLLNYICVFYTCLLCPHTY